MPGCCDHDSTLVVLQARQRATLRAALGINAVMFLVIAGAAFHANSNALLADSLDNFGDALTYGLSLYAVSRGAATKARVALFKGSLIVLAACVVGLQIVYRLFVPSTPVFELMGLFSFVGLVGNSLCVYLLWRHREEDVNMSSVWECSRNDIASNLSVFLAAGAVWLTGTGWPDTLVAAALVWFLMRSGFRVMASALHELRTAI